MKHHEDTHTHTRARARGYTEIIKFTFTRERSYRKKYFFKYFDDSTIMPLLANYTELYSPDLGKLYLNQTQVNDMIYLYE